MDEHTAKNTAYTIGVAAGALIEAMGMQAENQRLALAGDPPRYGFQDFHDLMESNGLHHNALIPALYN